MSTDEATGTATIRAAAAIDVAQVIREKGYDPEPVFAKAGMSLARAGDPYRQEELRRFTQLLELAAQVTDSPDFGLTMGKQQDPAKWGAFGYLMLNCPTVGAALENLATFLRPWQTGTHIACVRTSESIGIEYSIVHPSVVDKDQDAEMSISYVKHLVDVLCDGNCKINAVQFEHKPLSKLTTYKSVFGMTPLFEQAVNRILFPRSIERRRIESADLNLFPVLRQHLVDMANATPKNDDLLGCVTYLIRQALPRHQCSLKTVASALTLTPQTLQRRLKAGGMAFGDMVETIRRERAVEYLRTNHMEIKEISYLLGYNDASAFVKAFKRWTGKTPSQYREQVR